MRATPTTASLFAAGIGLAAAVWPASARAGGFEIPDLGTKAIGRGTAFVARADSLAAFHYNPAGLSKLPGPNLLVSVNVVNFNSEFTRRGSGMQVLPPSNEDLLVNDPAVDPNTGEPFAVVRNGSRFGPQPMLVFSWGDVGVRGLALHAGVVPAAGSGGHDWPEQGPQRYIIRDGRFLFLAVGGGISYRVNRYFSIGANFLSGIFTADFNTATRRGASVGDNLNEEHSSDNNVRIRVKDLFVPSANFGVLSQPLEWLELGLSVRLPYTSKARGDLVYEPGDDTPNAELASRSAVEIRQQFPTVIRAGVRYIHRLFDFEVDFVWENYSAVDSIRVKFSNPDEDFAPSDVLPVTPYDDPSLLYLDVTGQNMIFSPIIAGDVPLQWRDTYSIRVGSDIEVWPGHLTMRGGGWWQSKAYPDDNRTFNLRFPYTQQIAIGTGLTWHAIKQLDVTLGYQHAFQPEVVVTNGVVQQNAFRDPADLDTLRGNTVNNGRYRASLNTFGIALEAYFWRGRDRKKKKRTE